MRIATMIAAGVAAGLTLAPLTAHAQATPEGAEEIRLGLKEWIATTLTTPDKSVVFTFDQPLSVEPQGSSYRAVIPAAAIAFNDDEGKAAELKLDAIEILLTPIDKGWYEVSWTLPSTYLIDSMRPDDPDVEATIGSQSGSGVFAPQYRNFMALDAKLGDIAIGPTEGPDKGRITIRAVTLTSDSTEVGPETYDSNAVGAIDGVAGLDEDGTQVFDLDRIGFTADVAAVDMAAAAAFSDQLTELQHRLPPGEDGTTPPEFFTEMATLLQQAPKLFNSIEAGYSVEGLSVHEPASEGTPGTDVELGKASFGITLTGLSENVSTFRVAIDMASFGVDPVPEFAEFVPSAATFDVSVKDLPNEAMLQALLAFLQSAPTMGPDQAAEIAGMQLGQALMASTGAIEITAIRATAPAANFDLTGSFKPDATSPVGVVGGATLVVSGLEKAMETMQGMPDQADALAGLTMLQTMGAQATDAAGNPARKYVLEVAASGTILLNGTDLMPMLGGMMQ